MSNAYQIQAAKPTARLKVRADTNLQGLAIFCALGLLISLYAMIRYPEFGAMIAQFSQF